MTVATPVRRPGTGDAATLTHRIGMLAWVTIAGIALYVVLDVIAQALPPHYNPIRQTESDLAVGPYGWIMTVNFVVRGVLSAAAIVALAIVIAPTRRARLGLACLGVWTLGAFLLAIFPTDVGIGRQTVHGKLHLVIALLAFIAMPIAAHLLARCLAEMPDWETLGARSTRAAYLVAGGFVLLILGAAAPRLGGLTERLFLVSAFWWLLVVALGLRAGPDQIGRGS